MSPVPTSHLVWTGFEPASQLPPGCGARLFICLYYIILYFFFQVLFLTALFFGGSGDWWGGAQLHVGEAGYTCQFIAGLYLSIWGFGTTAVL